MNDDQDLCPEEAESGAQPPAAPARPGEQTLTGGDIELTSLRLGDSDTLFGWINDRVEVVHSAAYRPISRAEHDSWFESIQKRPDVVIFAIRRTDTGQLIGTCQLRDIEPVHRSAELVIRIGEPDQRGDGRGTLAVELLVRYGFRDLNLHRIQLSLFEDNRRARRAYEKAGFVSEGTRREAAFVDGQYKSLLMMRILEHEHDRRNPPT